MKGKWLWFFVHHMWKREWPWMQLNSTHKTTDKSTYGLISPLKIIALTRSCSELHNIAQRERESRTHTHTLSVQLTANVKGTSEEWYCGHYLWIQSFRCSFHSFDCMLWQFLSSIVIVTPWECLVFPPFLFHNHFEWCALLTQMCTQFAIAVTAIMSEPIRIHSNCNWMCTST